jgi:hypothetical protein
MSIQSARSFVEPILRKHAKDQSRQFAEKRMRGRAAAIAAKMATDPALADDPEFGDRDRIRYALYWLWKAVVQSGTAADVIRDRQDDRVIALLAGRTFTSNAEVVSATMDAALDLAW